MKRFMRAFFAVALFSMHASHASDVEEGEALIQAAMHNQLAQAIQLLDRGLNVDYTTKFQIAGRTALFFAVSKQHVDMVKLLISRGANVNAQDDVLGVTPLFFAVYNRDLEMVKLLLNANANPLEENIQNATPLSVAKDRGFEEIVSYMEGGGVSTKAALSRQ